jgi:biotin synthase-related radical SAM superfamily protein
MTAKKDQYLEQLKKQYDELNYRWSRERDKFEADLQHESVDIRKEYEAKREEYRQYRKDLQEKIVDLEVAGENAWEELKVGAEKSWKELSKAFDKASSHFKK